MEDPAALRSENASLRAQLATLERHARERMAELAALRAEVQTLKAPPAAPDLARQSYADLLAEVQMRRQLMGAAPAAADQEKTALANEVKRLHEQVACLKQLPSVPAASEELRSLRLREFLIVQERRFIVQAIHEAKGDLEAAKARLGISNSTLYRWVPKAGGGRPKALPIQR